MCAIEKKIKDVRKSKKAGENIPKCLINYMKLHAKDMQDMSETWIDQLLLHAKST